MGTQKTTNAKPKGLQTMIMLIAQCSWRSGKMLLSIVHRVPMSKLFRRFYCKVSGVMCRVRLRNPPVPSPYTVKETLCFLKAENSEDSLASSCVEFSIGLSLVPIVTQSRTGLHDRPIENSTHELAKLSSLFSAYFVDFYHVYGMFTSSPTMASENACALQSW